MAEPRSLNLSGSVHEQVRNKLELTFEDTGEHTVKNVSTPLRGRSRA